MMNKNNSSKLLNPISLIDFLYLLKKSWAVIFWSFFAGVITSLIYLWLTPNQYQALAQIRMAQTIHYGQANLTNVEDSNLLISRLRAPSSFSKEQIKACDLENSRAPYEDLVNVIKLSAPKSTSSIVELRVNGSSGGLAIQCAESIFEAIKNYQNHIVDLHLAEVRSLLSLREERLRKVMETTSQVEKSNNQFLAIYLLTNNELNSLRQEIFRLKNNIDTVELSRTQLVSPIYAFQDPLIPNTKVIILLGIMGGILLGLLLVSIKDIFKSN